MTRDRILLLLALVATPSLASADGPNRPIQAWAIVVGVPISGREGTAANARELRNRLVENLGWDLDHVLMMDHVSPVEHGGPEAKLGSLRATKDNLDWALTRWMNHRVRPGDLVVIYYAGRADVNEDGTGAHVLLTATDTPWKFDPALDSLASRGENPILVLLDSPHPAASDPNPAEGAKSGLRKSSRMLGILTRWPGVQRLALGPARFGRHEVLGQPVR